MEREILFRGKTSFGAWVYGDLVHDAFDGTSQRIEVGIRARNSYPVEVIPETVGQFTGLTDKNGKNIFDGDLCECNGVVYKVVQHVSGAYELYEKDEDPECSDPYFLFIQHDILKVVGNIHDNPELINK